MGGKGLAETSRFPLHELLPGHRAPCHQGGRPTKPDHVAGPHRDRDQEIGDEGSSPSLWPSSGPLSPSFWACFHCLSDARMGQWSSLRFLCHKLLRMAFWALNSEPSIVLWSYVLGSPASLRMLFISFCRKLRPRDAEYLAQGRTAGQHRARTLSQKQASPKWTHILKLPALQSQLLLVQTTN